MTEDEMVGWHHRLYEHELSTLWELVMDRETWRAGGPGVQAVLVCRRSWRAAKSRTRLSD